MTQSFVHLSVLPNKSVSLTKIGIIFDRDAYELQTHWTETLGRERSENLVVLTELWCVVNGWANGCVVDDGQTKTKFLLLRHQRKCESGWKYMKLNVKYLELRVLHIPQVLLATEWDLISKKCIQPQQRQNRTVSIWTISSERSKPLNKPLKSLVSYITFSHSLDLNWLRWLAKRMRFSWKKTEKIPFKINGLPSKSALTGSVRTHLNVTGKHQLTQSFNHLSVSSQKSFHLAKNDIIFVQVAYELQRPLDYKVGKNTKWTLSWYNRTRMRS